MLLCGFTKMLTCLVDRNADLLDLTVCDGWPHQSPAQRQLSLVHAAVDGANEMGWSVKLYDVNPVVNAGAKLDTFSAVWEEVDGVARQQYVSTTAHM